MELQKAQKIAERIKAELAPHCEKIEIAGSIRREKPYVKDIEIVAIPKKYNSGMFESGIATVVNRWEKVKGELPCKYTQRILPDGIKLDLFFADSTNWGFIYAIRTGSANFSKMLGSRWKDRGYMGKDGYIVDRENPVRKIYLPTERHFFALCGIDYLEPKRREI